MMTETIKDIRQPGQQHALTPSSHGQFDNKQHVKQYMTTRPRCASGRQLANASMQRYARVGTHMLRCTCPAVIA
jgi:hypothetical protein